MRWAHDFERRRRARHLHLDAALGQLAFAQFLAKVSAVAPSGFAAGLKPDGRAAAAPGYRAPGSAASSVIHAPWPSRRCGSAHRHLAPAMHDGVGILDPTSVNLVASTLT